jgi:phage terminase large subunit-like protein
VDYWFDARAADRAVEFIETRCVFTEDKWAGKPFLLEPWQKNDIIRPLFGWKRPDGLRRYRRCIVWIPRKNGKTELGASVSILALVATGVVGGQVYSIARDKNQARLVFDKAAKMVAMSPKLGEVLECFASVIYCNRLKAGFKPLSGNPKGKHGFSASGLIGDEIHEWDDDRLYTFVHQSEANREQPIEFLISTAGLRRGYGWELWDECLKIRDGVIDDPETLVVIYAADPTDDWTDPAVWKKANPNLGISVRHDYLAAECARAKESPRLENDFKRYHLNIWTEQATRWLPMESWDGCNTVAWQDLEAQVRGRLCYGGLDLSATTDITALVWQFDADDGQTILLPRFWVPEAKFEQRIRRDRVPYDKWRDMGALFTTPGNAVDYAAVKAQIMADAEIFRVGGLAIDRWNATQLSGELLDEGLPVNLFGQGFASMSAPSKELERRVLDRQIEHGGHPVLRWMAANAAIKTDPAGNIKPAKDESTDRIDGIVAAIMGIGLASSGAEPDPVSPWEDENFKIAVA